MTKTDVQKNAPALQAYADYESQLTGRHLRIGCLLVMTLMPAGVVLDYFVYPEKAGYFFGLRLASTLVAGMVWAFLRSSISQRFHHALGLFIALLPVFFICWMIYAAPADKGGAATSPYYAGLNLSLLAIAFVMRWSVGLSVLASFLVLAMYLTACLLRGALPEEQYGVFANNIYFLVLTSIVVVVGSRLHRVLRIREFTVRYELDERKRELEEAIRKLGEAEAQLVQQEKMASLGVWSAGIIHEINNPLNYATTGLYTLRQKGKYIAPEQQEDFADILKDVEEGVSRVKNIVSGMRMHTHTNTDNLDQVEVAEVIEQGLRFLSAELKDHVRIEQRWPEHQTVTANKQMLIQVFTNLLQNSLYALKTKTFTDEKPTIWIEGCVENGRSLLTVRDNGPGIESKHLNKIFDPFFTTKDVGEGQGLGLTICYRIMHESGGRISVKTEPGKFCEFTLEFPAKG